MLDPLHIIIDSREQSPWAWEQSDATVEVAGLACGDYALSCDTEMPKRNGALRPVRFALERKSLDDFAQSVSSQWDRFIREMERASTWQARMIIGEFDLEDLCFSQVGSELIQPPHNHPQLRPAFMLRRIAELGMMNITVLMCGDAQKASAMALHIFRRRMSDIAGLSK